MKSPDLHRWLACLRRPALRPLFRIPTHLTSRERATLHRLARERERAIGGPARVVEIGSYLGASAAFMAAALREPGSRVYCIDTWTNEAMSEGRRDTRDTFLHNTAAFADRIVPVQGWSTDAQVMARVREEAGHIDLLFIDGDHGYEGAKADWVSYAPLLAPGATIVLHDVGWAEGVQQVLAECVAPVTRDAGSLRNLWWGTLA
jgi:predicted O-methyltransferase YrrM